MYPPPQTVYVQIPQLDWECLVQKIDELQRIILDERAKNERVLTVKEAAAFLGISRTTFYRYYNEDHLIPSTKIGGKVFFQQRDLVKFIDKFKTNKR